MSATEIFAVVAEDVGMDSHHPGWLLRFGFVVTNGLPDLWTSLFQSPSIGESNESPHTEQNHERKSHPERTGTAGR
jgi:hypothetical protein